jgi:hypothetical protein
LGCVRRLKELYGMTGLNPMNVPFFFSIYYC